MHTLAKAHTYARTNTNTNTHPSSDPCGQRHATLGWATFSSETGVGLGVGGSGGVLHLTVTAGPALADFLAERARLLARAAPQRTQPSAALERGSLEGGVGGSLLEARLPSRAEWSCWRPRSRRGAEPPQPQRAGEPEAESRLRKRARLDRKDSQLS